jgi:hypothetical protein
LTTGFFTSPTARIDVGRVDDRAEAVHTEHPQIDTQKVPPSIRSAAFLRLRCAERLRLGADLVDRLGALKITGVIGRLRRDGERDVRGSVGMMPSPSTSSSPRARGAAWAHAFR